MDCREAQEQILESLTEPRLGGNSAELDHHLAECDNCRRFFETQRHLDLQLGLAISAPPLSPQFRKSVMEKARREPYSIWHELLPDKAHWAGCVCATASGGRNSAQSIKRYSSTQPNSAGVGFLKRTAG